MKAVLQSIQPQYCVKTTSGKKLDEVRKNKPKLEVPFKVYIYCTQGKPYLNSFESYYYRTKTLFLGEDYLNANMGDGGYQRISGKVIGEYVCDHIEKICPDNEYYSYGYDVDDDLLRQTCLCQEELMDYGKGKILYAWHISDLKIYDKPKDLSEFRVSDNEAIKNCKHRFRAGQPEHLTNSGWLKGSYICMKNGEPEWCEKCLQKPLTRPPQSWCYVEEQRSDKDV